jgi:hypothetical protein
MILVNGERQVGAMHWIMGVLGNRVAVITGSTRGLGLATAQAYRSEATADEPPSS